MNELTINYHDYERLPHETDYNARFAAVISLRGLGLHLDGRVRLHILFSPSPIVGTGARREIHVKAHDTGRPRRLQELREATFPAWSVRSAAISAASSKGGTSAMPVRSAVPCCTTGPAWVRYRLWQLGKDQRLRVTPARGHVLGQVREAADLRAARPSPAAGRRSDFRWRRS